MTKEDYEKAYEYWEQSAEKGLCSWKFAAARIALISIDFGQTQLVEQLKPRLESIEAAVRQERRR